MQDDDGGAGQEGGKAGGKGTAEGGKGKKGKQEGKEKKAKGEGEKVSGKHQYVHICRALQRECNRLGTGASCTHVQRWRLGKAHEASRISCTCNTAVRRPTRLQETAR